MEGDSSPNTDGALETYYNHNQSIQILDIDDDVDYVNRSFRDFSSPYKRVLRGYKRG